jgi:hypothetical protein
MVVVGIVVGVCVLLLILGVLLPRFSQRPQHGVDRALEAGRRGAGHAPGRLGRWLGKPFGASERAADKSASTGRRGRAKLPL